MATFPIVPKRISIIYGIKLFSFVVCFDTATTPLCSAVLTLIQQNPFYLLLFFYPLYILFFLHFV